jgi:uncharacterized membrane protein YkoI
MHRFIKHSVLATAIAASGAVACAAQSGTDNDAIAIAKAKTSLAQAVATAEQHAHGKATNAEYESSTHGQLYDVEVVSGAKVIHVKVDADKGTVISSAEDKTDRDDDKDEQD